MASKTIIFVWLVALALVPLRLVEAQSQGKIAKIGWLAVRPVSGFDRSRSPEPHVRRAL
ncbi:MAG TPA: hypothetical protein VI585_22905 [Candidatus Binatia bacterium]